MVWLFGVIAIEVAKAFVTVSAALTEVWPLCAGHPVPHVAVTVSIVVLVELPAVTSPLVGMVLLIWAPLPTSFQLTRLVTSADVPSLIFAVARNCCKVLAAIRALAGLMPLSDAIKAAVIDRLVLPVAVPELAVTMTEPCALPVSSPLAEIAARFESDDVQLTALVRSLLVPSLYMPVAVSCTVRPAATDADAAFTWMDFRAAAPLFPLEFEVAAQPVNNSMAATEHTSTVLIGSLSFHQVGEYLKAKGRCKADY